MPTVLNDDSTRTILERLRHANRRVAEAYPGERADRQPVHTVYGGAHLFRADTARRLGESALAALAEHAPDAPTFARALGRPERDGLAETLHARVLEKLRREPVEDYRLDFEDGYGVRPDAEEDRDAVAAAGEVALGLANGTLPSFVGLRIKPLSEELRARSLRTLDLFVATLLERTGGVLPPQFVVTLAKVVAPEQVAALAEVLELIERGTGLFPGSLRIELMIETPQSVLSPQGEVAIPHLVAAARGRCRAAHFGVYDYTAACAVTAAHQEPRHPACDFARHVMQVSLAGTGVTLSDGATAVMPVGPHRAGPGDPALTAGQREENRHAVHRAWKLHYEDVRRSLRHAFYQGWDLHPAQLPTRYAAVFAFFLEGRAEAAARLKAFVAKAAQATLVGSVFDDAATGQGLLNFFLRGLGCGALTEEEALEAGLTLEELRGKSFTKLLAARRGR